MSDSPFNPAPLIAVIGCDGSGKSTLTGELHDWLNSQHPTVTCHLGKQSGNLGRQIAALPLLGRQFEKSIQAKSRKAQGDRGPGYLAALVIYLFALRRVRRFRRMQRLRSAGNLILADRFPQNTVPEGMDGPGLLRARATGLIGWLARSEQRMFEGMVAQNPDLVLRLNVSVETAIARKPDHDPEALARKIGEVHKLRYGTAPIVELDAHEPLEIVLTSAKAAITVRLAERTQASAVA